MKKITLFTLLFGFILSINAQLDNYTFTEANNSGYPQVSSAATSLYTAGDDEETTGVPIGFDFYYRGTMYNTCTVGVNGAISFTESQIYTANNLASTTNGHINMVAPLWDDLHLYAADNGWIKYETTGTAPNRIFTASWYNIAKHQHAGEHCSFLIQLKEGSNDIVFWYGHNDLTSLNASIGINANDGTTTTFKSVTPGTPATVSSSTANNSISAADSPEFKHYTFTFDSARNDINSRAIPITLAAPRDATHTNYYANNVGATNSGGNAPTCANFQGGDVWFKFTAPSTGAVNLITDGVFGSGSTLGFAIYHNSFSSTVQYCGSVPSANIGDRKLIKDLVDGDTYYLRMWDAYNNDFGIVPFYLETIEVNDEAANAKDIAVFAEDAPAFVLTYADNTYTTGSEAINGSPACGSYNGGDLWYKFTAPTTGEVVVRHVDAAADWSSLAYAIYDSPTANTTVDCHYIPVTGTPPFNTFITTGLTAGNDYWLRVWDYGDDNIGSSGDFHLTDNDTNGIEDYQALDFSYFPNPATDFINVNAEKDINHISIMNLTGQEVRQVTPNTNNTQVNIANLPQGVYLMRVDLGGDQSKVVKIIKK